MLAVNTIKSVRKVYLDKNCRSAVSIPLAPLAGDLDAHFNAEGLGNAELEGEKVVVGLFFNGKA